MSLDSSSVIRSLEFSPYPDSSNLLALGVNSGVAIKSCALQVLSLWVVLQCVHDVEEVT